MSMSEFERLWGWAPVPHEVRIEKGAWNNQPVVSSSRPDTKRSIWGELPPRDVRRLNDTFVQEQDRRVRAQISLYDALSNNVVGWRYEKVAVEGRMTRRGDSLNGGRYRNWRNMPRSVLLEQMDDDWREYIGLNEPDEEVGKDVQEQPDWKALARVNADRQQPTIGSVTSFQYRVRESNP